MITSKCEKCQKDIEFGKECYCSFRKLSEDAYL